MAIVAADLGHHLLQLCYLIANLLNLPGCCSPLGRVNSSDTLHNPRHDHRGNKADETDPTHHQQDRDHPAHWRDRVKVAITHCGECGECPPDCVTDVLDIRARARSFHLKNAQRRRIMDIPQNRGGMDYEE